MVFTYLSPPEVSWSLPSIGLFFMLAASALVGCTKGLSPEPRELVIEVTRGASALEIALAKREAILIDLARRRGLPEADASAILYVQMLRGGDGTGPRADDPALRRRMIYWGEKILEERLDARLDEAALNAFLEASGERFILAARYRMALIYLSRSRQDPADLEELVKRASALSLPVGEEASAAFRLGDPKIGLSSQMNLTAEAIARRFGAELAEFAESGHAREGEWSAPIVSEDGVYRFYLFERTPPRLPRLDELGPRLRASLIRELRVAKREESLRELLPSYRMTLIERSE